MICFILKSYENKWKSCFFVNINSQWTAIRLGVTLNSNSHSKMGFLGYFQPSNFYLFVSDFIFLLLRRFVFQIFIIIDYLFWIFWSFLLIKMKYVDFEANSLKIIKLCDFEWYRKKYETFIRPAFVIIYQNNMIKHPPK